MDKEIENSLSRIRVRMNEYIMVERSRRESLQQLFEPLLFDLEPYTISNNCPRTLIVYSENLDDGNMRLLATRTRKWFSILKLKSKPALSDSITENQIDDVDELILKFPGITLQKLLRGVEDALKPLETKE